MTPLVDRSRANAIERTRGHLLALDRALRAMSALAPVYPVGVELDRARAQAGEVARRIDLDLELELEVEFQLDRVRILRRARAGVEAVAAMLDRARVAGPVPNRPANPEFRRLLRRARGHARGAARSIDDALRRAAQPTGHQAGHASRAAGRILVAAVFVLPPAQRLRYAEEFQSELAELVRDDEPRRRQLLYALRLVDRAFELRVELLGPARQRAGG